MMQQTVHDRLYSSAILLNKHSFSKADNTSTVSTLGEIPISPAKYNDDVAEWLCVGLQNPIMSVRFRPSFPTLRTRSSVGRALD